MTVAVLAARPKTYLLILGGKESLPSFVGVYESLDAFAERISTLHEDPTTRVFAHGLDQDTRQEIERDTGLSTETLTSAKGDVVALWRAAQKRLTPKNL